MVQLAEFFLIAETSSLTFSVAGVVKEICTLTIAVAYVRDKHLTWVNVLGMVVRSPGTPNQVAPAHAETPMAHVLTWGPAGAQVSVAGVALYNAVKIRKGAKAGERKTLPFARVSHCLSSLL